MLLFSEYLARGILGFCRRVLRHCDPSLAARAGKLANRFVNKDSFLLCNIIKGIYFLELYTDTFFLITDRNIVYPAFYILPKTG